MLAIGLLAAVAATIVVGSRTPGTTSSSWIVAILASMTLLGGILLRRGRHVTAALASPELREAVGAFSRTSDLNARWWGRVADARFGSDRPQEGALETGASHRASCLAADGAARILASERIPPDAPAGPAPS